MDQKRVTKDNSCSNQSFVQPQYPIQDPVLQRLAYDLNSGPFMLEEESKRVFDQSRKIISDIKAHNDQKLLNNITLDQFIITSNLFFDSSFTNIFDKRILFAAFAMIHQFYLSSNFVPILEHMLPFSTLWETFNKVFKLLDFNTCDSKISEILDKIKQNIDNGKEPKEEIFVDDYDDILATISLLYQCFESIKNSSIDSSKFLDKFCIAVNNAYKYISEAQSISAASIHEIKIQLTLLQHILKSYQRSNTMIDTIAKINDLMLTIPTQFDSIKIPSNSIFYHDVSYLNKIVKTIIDFYTIFFKLMVNITDWKEAKELFMSTQEIYTLIEQPYLTGSTTNLNNSKLIKIFSEKVTLYSRDKTFKDEQILKELNSIINILPPELVHVRSSFTNFLLKRRESSPEFNDTLKIYSIFQSCVNFASQLRPSNGPIYSLTYKLLQAYSKSLINSIISDDLETVLINLNRINFINLSKNSSSKQLDSMVIDIPKIAKLTQEFISCDIISDEYKDFMNRFQLFTFFLKNYFARLPQNKFSKVVQTLIQFFPNFKALKISKKWLKKDLNFIFQANSEMVQNQLSQIKDEPHLSNLQDFKKSTDSVILAYSFYGQIIKEFDYESINQFNLFLRFKKCLEDFTCYLHKDESSRFEVLIEPTDFTILLTRILEKTQSFISEKLIFDSNIFETCFDISISLLYKERALPQYTIIQYLRLLRYFNIPSFKQKLQISLRYSELFVLMENDKEVNQDIEKENENIALDFGQYLINFCSYAKEESYEGLLSLLPDLKKLIPSFIFFGFDNMIDTIKKFDSLLANINQINSFFFLPTDCPNKLYSYDMILLSSMIESISSSFDKFIFYRVLTKESASSVQKVLSLLKDMYPISLYSFLLYANPELEKIDIGIEVNAPPSKSKKDDRDDKKPTNLKGFLKYLHKMLFDLSQSIQFSDYQKVVKDKLSILSSIFSFYINWCPELKFLNEKFCEVIQLSNHLMNDFSPILFRIFKTINAIYSTPKLHDSLTLEITSLHQINQNVHSIILNALSVISIKKDLKIILNYLNCIFLKYQSDEEKINYPVFPVDDFFNYKKINSPYIQKLFEAMQELYNYDSKSGQIPPENLTFSEVYEVITPSLPIINNLFDESIHYFVRNFYIDGCKQIGILTKKLESSIESIDTKISEENKIIKSQFPNSNNNEDDGEAVEIPNINESKEKTENSIATTAMITETHKMPSFNETFDSVFEMYKNILENKIKQNKILKKNIDELKAKVDEHKTEMDQINQELIKFTQVLIPTEFESISRQILEPLKNFQIQEAASNAEKSEAANEEAQFDIFSGSEFNSQFVNSILMKIDELEQQNNSLTRYIKIQAFYSVVDEYLRTHKQNKKDADNNENLNDSLEFKEDENGNPIKPNEDDDYEYEYEYVDDDEKLKEYEEFENDEMKLIMMINSLRNCGKNKATLREIITDNFKESMSKIELDFYRLIEKAQQLFNVEELADVDIGDDGNNYSSLISNDQRRNSKKSSERRNNLLKMAQSLVLDESSDDN